MGSPALSFQEKPLAVTAPNKAWRERYARCGCAPRVNASNGPKTAKRVQEESREA